jgi:hypothetical protein
MLRRANEALNAGRLSEGAPPTSRPQFPFLLLTSVVFVSSFLLIGYSVYTGNHAVQIPLVKQLANPSLYPGDPFVPRVPHRISILWWILAGSLAIAPLEPLMLVLYMIERLLTVYAAGRLARSLVPTSELAVFLARLLFCLPLTPPFGHGTLVRDYLEQTGCALPFFMLGMAAFYELRPFACSVFLAVGFDLNCLYGVYALTYLSIAFLIDRHFRESWRLWILPTALFLLLATPVLYLMYSFPQFATVDDQLWLAASYVRSPHHLLPHTWGSKPFVKYGILLLVYLFTSWKSRKLFGGLSKHVFLWSVVSVSWVICAFLAANTFKTPFLLNLQPARGPDLAYCLASIGVISFWAKRFEIARDRKSLCLVAIVLATLIAALTTTDFSRLLSLMLILLAFAALRWDLSRIPAQFLGSPRRLAAILVLMLLALTALAFFSPSSPTNLKGTRSLAQEAVPLKGVAEWARKHTAIDSIFLVDPLWSEFRALSERSAFVTWEDGTALFVDRSLAAEWTRRLQWLGWEVPSSAPSTRRPNVKGGLQGIYANLRDDDVDRIRSHYPVDYWIVSRDHRSGFPAVFFDDRWKVLDLRKTKRPAPPAR